MLRSYDIGGVRLADVHNLGTVAAWASSLAGGTALATALITGLQPFITGLIEPTEAPAAPPPDAPSVSSHPWAYPRPGRLTRRTGAGPPTIHVSGPRGIIASGNQVGLIGAHTDPALLVVGRLEKGTFIETSRTNLRSPTGGPLARAEIHCRGSEAHLFSNATWHSFDLNELD